MTIGIIFVVLSLVLLIFLAYKGISVMVLAPLMALLAYAGSTVFIGGSGHFFATYTEVFMKGAGTFIINNFPVFLLGAIYGKFLEVSGSADAIANFVTGKLGSKYAIFAGVITGAILTYGGVSLFVVAFAMYPICAKLYKEAGLNKRLVPATITLSAFTFGMIAPGSPQIQNAIPMRFLGTNAFAAPLLGLIAALLEFGLGTIYLSHKAKVYEKKYGKGYGEWTENLVDRSRDDLPGVFVAFLPIIITLVTNLIFSRIVFPNYYDGAFLETEYNTTLQTVYGTWSLIAALIISIIVCVGLNWKRFGNFTKTLSDGVNGSFLAIFNTASENGYGTVIATLAAYGVIAGGITGISSNPLIATALGTTIMAGITGSGSGGLTIALTTIGDQLIEMANARNISLDIIHRVAVVVCGGLDSLPHNGAVITVLGICQMSHKDGYKDIGVCTVVIPLITAVVCVILGSLGVC